MVFVFIFCCRSSGVEHFIGNEEVGGSIPLDSTIKFLDEQALI